VELRRNNRSKLTSIVSEAGQMANLYVLTVSAFVSDGDVSRYAVMRGVAAVFENPRRLRSCVWMAGGGVKPGMSYGST
jgi:hypothetical protein